MILEYFIVEVLHTKVVFEQKERTTFKVGFMFFFMDGSRVEIKLQRNWRGFVRARVCVTYPCLCYVFLSLLCEIHMVQILLALSVRL
jgi:hypothetical protein